MVNYGQPCNKDDDCSSKICEMTFVDGLEDKRKCVLQEIQHGETCNYNRECDSNRCVMVFDGADKPLGKKCLVINGQHIPNRRDWETDDEYSNSRSAKWNAGANQEILLSNTQKRIAFEGHGILTDIIVLAMEIVVYFFKEIIKLLISIWKLILYLVSWPFESIYSSGWDGFSKIYMKRNEKGDLIHPYQCKDKSLTIRPITLIRFITVLFPPLGVFLDRGANGFGHILITSILTAIFYFPGMIYAMMLINDTMCPNSIEIFTKPNYKGKRYIFSYGDYSVLQNETLKKITCNNIDEVKFDNNSTDNIKIGSIKIGRRVNLVLYKDKNFTETVYTATTNIPVLTEIPEISNQSDWSIECNSYDTRGKEETYAIINSFSIRLKKPPKLVPEIVQDQEVIFYMLNDFRGQMISLDSGTYNSKDLTKLFNGRISSIRIGKNMKIGLFEHNNFNRKHEGDYDSFNDFIKNIKQHTWSDSGGNYMEATYENVIYENTEDVITDGKIPNLSLYSFNDTIQSIIICNNNNTCNIDNIAKASEN